MKPLATPDITLTQVITAIGTLLGVLAGVVTLDNLYLRITCVAGAFAVLVAWIIADAIIRNGRAKYAAAVVGTPAPPA